MPDKNEDLLKLARQRFRESYDYDLEDRADALDDLKFAWNFEGYQWPSSIRSQRENDPNGARPCLVFNKIPEKLDQVEGEFRQARPDAQVIAVDSKADPIIAEIYGGILKQIDYASTSRAIYNYAYSYLLHCGRCAWRVNTKKSEENPFNKELIIQGIKNPFTIYDDPYREKIDGSDRNYIFLTELMRREDYEKQYGEDVESWETFDGSELWWSDENVRIAQYWYKEVSKEKVYLVKRTASDSQIVTLIVTEDQKQDSDTVEDETTQDKITIYHCKLGGMKVLEDPKEWKGDLIPIIHILANQMNIDGKQRSRGKVRHAKDPQRMLNYWASTNTETLALAPKAPFLITPTMMGDFKAVWDTAGKFNWPNLPFEPDPKMPGSFPQRQFPPSGSPGFINEIMRLEHDIMAAMGIYQASVGDKSNEKSGIAIENRQRQGSIGSTSFVDMIELGITLTSKIEIGMIPFVYDTEQVLRIRGEDDTEKKIPINVRPGLNLQDYDKKLIAGPRPGISEFINDLTVGKYDVRAKIGPSYTTQREEAFDKLFTLLSKAPNLIPAVIDLLVKNIDIPGSQELISRLEKIVPANLKDEEQEINPQMIAQQVQQQMLQLKEFKDQMLAEREQVRKDFGTKIKAFEAKINAIKTIADAEAAEPGKNIEEYKDDLTDFGGAMNELLGGIQEGMNAQRAST